MKSSKDIIPRVGMQVRWNGGPVEVVSKVTNRIWFTLNGVDSGSCELPDSPEAFSWQQGLFTIEWFPPTDEERKMFMDAAKQYETTGEFPMPWSDAWTMCATGKWNLRDTGRYANQHLVDIAESLAMDGL